MIFSVFVRCEFKMFEKEDIDEIPYWPNLGPPQTRSNIHWSILARILYGKSLQNMEDLISKACAKMKLKLILDLVRVSLAIIRKSLNLTLAGAVKQMESDFLRKSIPICFYGQNPLLPLPSPSIHCNSKHHRLIIAIRGFVWNEKNKKDVNDVYLFANLVEARDYISMLYF